MDNVLDGRDHGHRRFDAEDLSIRFDAVRDATEALAAGLTAEDQCVQSMPDASPAKWHRAHTTWFFEQFVLVRQAQDYRVFDRDFNYLFNSYYEAVGPRHPRAARGLLTRPSADHVTLYRQYVDAAMRRALPQMALSLRAVVELGLHHEQQHQELLITDMLHAFSHHPLFPAMLPEWKEAADDTGDARFTLCPGGLHTIGHDGPEFCFDNETPRHQVLLQPYRLASRLVRNRDWLGFIEDRGYQTSSLWMSDGWAVAQANGWDAPMHWRWIEDMWLQMGPGGLVPLLPDAPVRHISWYEADAFARWNNARLPTEFEWEAACSNVELSDMTGRVWQWTESAYRPYPSYRAVAGAIGEYNGKFMINQMVLRGSSKVTSAGHTRPAYRNFFHPDKRWQFSGLRLARDL